MRLSQKFLVLVIVLLIVLAGVSTGLVALKLRNKQRIKKLAKSGLTVSSLKVDSCFFKSSTHLKGGGFVLGGSCLKTDPKPFKRSRIGFLVKFDQNLAVDPNFGHRGYLFLTSKTTTWQVQSLQTTRDNDILVSGIMAEKDSATNQDVFVIKLNSDGVLDPDYAGGQGVLLLHSIESVAETLNQSLIQLDGTLLLVGHLHKRGIGNVVLLRRVFPEGAIDPQFGLKSQLIHGKAKAVTSLPPTLGSGIVIVGYSRTEGFAASFRADGSTNTNFGQDGIFKIQSDGVFRPTTIKIQENQWLLVGGNESQILPSDQLPGEEKQEKAPNLSGPALWHQTHSQKARLLRLSKDGKLDTHFSKQGNLHWGLKDYQHTLLFDLLTDPSGKFIVLGNSSRKGIPSHGFIGRFTAYGNIDTGFGEKGLMIPNELSLGSDGSYLINKSKIITAGYRDTPQEDSASKPRLVVSQFDITASRKDIKLENEATLSIPIKRGFKSGVLEFDSKALKRRPIP